MSTTKIPLQIAIDGPVAAGKGDIAARLAKKLHITYINTGAMYRMLALACLNQNVLWKDEPAVVKVLDTTKIDFQPPIRGSKQTYLALLDGRDVTDRLLDPDISHGSSDVGTLSRVREKMVKFQQNIARGRGVVMEGRDIGLRVLPDAQLKIYLTAALKERAMRRWKQWKERGIRKTLGEVIEEIKKRDEQDMGRAADPLQKLPDAWELDTTGLIQKQVIEKIIKELKRKNLI